MIQNIQFMMNNFLLGQPPSINGDDIPISTMFEGSNQGVNVAGETQNLSNLITRSKENFSGNCRVFSIDLGEPRPPQNLIAIFKGLDLGKNSEMILAETPVPTATDLAGINLHHGWRAGPEVYYCHLVSPQPAQYWKLIFLGEEMDQDLTDIFFGGSVEVEAAVSVGITHNVVDPSQLTYVDSGRAYAIRRPQYQVVSGIRLPFLNRQQVTAFKNFSNSKGITEPFWVSIDPQNLWDGPAFSATFGAYRFDGMPVFNHEFLDKFSASFSLREAL